MTAKRAKFSSVWTLYPLVHNGYSVNGSPIYPVWQASSKLESLPMSFFHFQAGCIGVPLTLYPLVHKAYSVHTLEKNARKRNAGRYGKRATGRNAGSVDILAVLDGRL